VVLLKNVKNIFLIPELTKKILFTLGVLIIYRLGTFIPVVGVNIPLVKEQMDKLGTLSGLLRYLDIFSGGALEKCTIFALGIGPYITASIMMQMLSMAVPYFEALAKEGDYGRRMINQYTRYLAVILSIGYSLGYATWLESAGLALTPGWGFKAIFVLSLTVGSVFVMWLGEQISLMGIGNGSSMIIFAGIISNFPNYIFKTIHWVQSGNMSSITAVFVLLLFLLLAACVVFLEKGDRKVPIQYTRRIIGQKVYGGQSTYIPFKINPAGVMPAILSSSVLSVPLFGLSFLADKFPILKTVTEELSRNGLIYNILQFALIVFFTFFYTALLFNAQELSEQLKKSGGFIPMIRPGKQTADYFDYVLTRIAFVGAIYLGFLAIVPNVVIAALKVPFYLSGTSLLIVVGVALETAAQIESYLIEHRYEGFLTAGRLKNRLAR
jgi:preprotein translocase subunit SecY